MYVKLTIAAIAAGFVIDCFLGDPARFPHPVILIGKAISFLEKVLRKRFPADEKGEFKAGCIMTAIVAACSGLIPFFILFFCRKVNIWLYFAVCCFMCWQIFAAKCLKDEAMIVYVRLRKGRLEAARKQVGMLVGRDTDQLTEEQVIKAAVETVAENTSDGVIAPLFWMIIFGPVGGFVYKAINTMDSMVGYKNDKYLYFGRCSAKTDDVANFIPARLSALGMIAAAKLTGFDAKNAFRIWKRDRRKHSSPNSAQTESVCAGALHIRLGGDASYFGQLYKKPTMGDPDREPKPKDIPASCKLMYGTSIILLAVLGAAALIVSFLI